MKKFFFLLIFLWCFFSSKDGLRAEGGEKDLRIGRILTARSNVFASTGPPLLDFVYKTADQIHIVTKESFLRRDILFKEGDVFDMEVIRESERNLRKRRLFRSVSITPLQPQNGLVDILIETQDAWTTTLNASLGAAGGKYYYSLGLFEKNFLGQGIKVGGFIEQDFDRFVKGFSIHTPHFFGKSHEFFYGYGTDSDGFEWESEVIKPYRSISAKESYGAKVRVSDTRDRLFQSGDEVAHFFHKTRFFRSFFSRTPHVLEGRALRFYLAQEYDHNEFSDFYFENDWPHPRDHTTSALLVGLERRRNNFIKEKAVYTFDRVEDINLAWEFFSEVGPSLESFGATRDGAFGRAHVDKEWMFSQNDFFRLSGRVEGRYEGEKVANGISTVELKYTKPHWRPGHTAALRGEFENSRNLDPENQFILGGENGLRGYSIRQYTGSQKMLFNLENRELLWEDVWRLVSIGWAAFFDTGAVWNQGKGIGWKDFKSDVGLGIRFTPSRSYNPGIIRMDLAYALDDNQRRSRWVVNIGADLTIDFQGKRKFEK